VASTVWARMLIMLSVSTLYNCYHVLFLVGVSMFQYKSGCLLSFQKFWYFKFRLFNVPILLFEEHELYLC
jgi:hypothetical protein